MASTADLVTNSVQDLNDANNDKQEPKNKKTLRERLIFIKNAITVEPLLTAYIMAGLIASPALTALEYQKACSSNLNYADEVCDAIVQNSDTNYTNETAQIVILISEMHSWQYPLQSVMPIILILFLGSYSDRHKLRKPFLLIPIMGEFFSVIGCILSVANMKAWPLEFQGIAQNVIPSFFGGQTMLVMAAFSYIADVSTLEMRTLRLGIVQIVMNTIVPITQSFAGALFYKIGYYGIFGITTGLFAFALAYGFFYIKEPREPEKMELKKSFFIDLFDPKQAIETVNILLIKKKGNNRLYICLVMVILLVISTVNFGEYSVLFFYVQTKLHWSIEDYSFFLAANTAIHLIGTILGVPLFTNLLKWTDYTILLIAFLNKIIGNIIFGLAQTTTIFYVGSIVTPFIGLYSVAIRSMATKVVSENDLGKTQSLFGICEALALVISSPFYNLTIYINTIKTFPSAFFFVGVILIFLCMVLVFLMYLRYKRKINKVQQQTNGAASNGTEKPVAMEEFQVTHM